MQKLLCALTLCIALAGCVAPVAMGLGAAAGAAQIPAWLSTAQEVVTGVKVLSATAQAFCGLQADANAQGNARLSYWAGLGCTY